MKKTKKLVSLLMALAMVFSLLAVNASAATPPDAPGISPLDVTGPTEHILNPYASSQTIIFNISEGFNWYKIAIGTYTPDIRFSISQAFGNKETVFVLDGTVTPNGKSQAYYGYLPTGSYLITVSVLGGGHNLGGKLWYKTATNEADAM